MVRIGKTIVSFDILREYFACDIEVCGGGCCWYGDSGAPLTKAEVKLLEKIYPAIVDYLPARSAEVTDRVGRSVTDSDGEMVTPLVGGKECAYAICSNKIFSCAIEKASESGVVKFRKPLSCHLFPVRVSQLKGFLSVSYEQWQICESGRKKGLSEGILLYEFLKEPLIRRFGEAWYRELLSVRREMVTEGLID